MPLFDTQLAAMVCGYGEEVGYETLVAQLAKARIDKSSRFTDWARRPLSPQQLAYALADVTHLRTVYQNSKQKLEETGRSSWVAQELAGLTGPATYQQPPAEAWRRLKVRSRDPRFLAIVQALAAWRERSAQQRDLPRNRVLRDDLLLEVAANRPITLEQLAKLRRINLDRRSAPAVVEAIQSALALPQAELPERRAAAQARPRPRPADRPAPGAAQAQMRGASRRPAPGRDHRRSRGDRRRSRARGRSAPGLALRGLRQGRARAEAGRARPRHAGRAPHPRAPHRSGAISGGRPRQPGERPRRAGLTESMPKAASGTGRILIVGRNSFLARQVLGALPAERVRAVGHDQIDRPDLLDGVATVVNFARHPLLGSEHYRPEAMDADLRLAERIGTRRIAYLMLSSRKVYAPGPEPLAETAPTGPTDAYGRAKLSAEQSLRQRLGERLTILRLANVFGYERTLGRRTFLSLVLERLRAENEIHLDISPFVARDFLPAASFASLLGRIAQAPPGGILNVGSGIALPTGRLALWILEGYGQGRLVITSPREHDPFVLDIARLKGLHGRPCSLDDLRRACLDLGHRLAAEPGNEPLGSETRGRPKRSEVRRRGSRGVRPDRRVSSNLSGTNLPTIRSGRSCAFAQDRSSIGEPPWTQVTEITRSPRCSPASRARSPT